MACGLADHGCKMCIRDSAYGDVYRGTEFRFPGPGKAELLFTGADGAELRETVYEFECPGILQGTYNKDTSIASFARSCFNYCLLYTSCKRTAGTGKGKRRADGYFVSRQRHCEHQLQGGRGGHRELPQPEPTAAGRGVRAGDGQPAP